jgi:hypothetical protein
MDRVWRKDLKHIIGSTFATRQMIEGMPGHGRNDWILARNFHMDVDLKVLIESFYRSIREDVPIPCREILLTSRIMDAIFDQLNAAPRARIGPMSSDGIPEWCELRQTQDESVRRYIRLCLRPSRLFYLSRDRPAEMPKALRILVICFGILASFDQGR